MMNFRQYCSDLETKIKSLYEDSPTIEEAEKLAAEFLHAQIVVSSELKKIDLSARMHKQGNKTVRAALYLEEVKKSDKKPTEAQLTAILDSSELVTAEQTAYDESEVAKAEAERLYDIMREAHIFLRGLAKGNLG